MKLTKFKWSLKLDQLIQEMGASEIVQLKDVSWEELENRGIDLDDFDKININEDGTLSYEGDRVLAYIRDQYAGGHFGENTYRYHFADCRTLRNMKKKDRYGRYVATTRKDGKFIVNKLYTYSSDSNKQTKTDVEKSLRVCWNCLVKFDWHHFRSVNRKQQNIIVESFTPEEYFKHFKTDISKIPTHDEHSAPLNEYPDNWPDISKAKKIEQNWTCEECFLDLSAEEDHGFLQTHHKNGLKNDVRPSNLKVLCLRCHAKEFGHQQVRNHRGYSRFLNKYRTHTLNS